jgi:membrane-bound lytic murein transglycosylase B
MTAASRVRGHSVALCVGALVALVGLAVYAVNRPPPMLSVRPVDVVVAAPPSPADQPSVAPRSSSLPAVASAWVATTSRTSGVPEPAVRAYGVATLRSAQRDPACHLSWTTLAGIGWVESEQGTIGGRVLDADGRPDRPITGVTLDGRGKVAAVPDGAGGYERALGPMQFIPSTWRQWGVDGDGDGTADPQDLDDAAYSAARYLCASGQDLATGAGWSAAILSYNHSDAYVEAVYAAAKAYAERTS